LQAVGKGACEQLLAALPKVKGKSRLYVVQGLSAVGGDGAAEALRGALDEGDDEVRLAAAWGLASLADAKSTDAMLAFADTKGSTWRRDQATQACLQLAENLRGAGDARKAARIYKHLRDTRTGDDERYIRQAAEQALADA
jgi:HEAT repeat protein